MMIVAQPAENAFTLLLIEAGLTAIAFAAACILPRSLSRQFAAVERLAGRLARRRNQALVCVAAALLVLRCALLPWFPPPPPNSTDDFSFLLAADTFAHGRLTNPTPAVWTHLESIHITMQPTYMSMYFPGPGLVMAASKVLFGHPWTLILFTGALMCASLCWMLQAWLPPGWALLGGFIAVLRIGLFSYWVNSYTGGATLSATGGALVLGAMPRLIRTGRFRYAMLLAVGIVLLLLTRPYEGLLLCLPVAFLLGRWILSDERKPAPRILIRRSIAPLALILAALAFLGYYDLRAFGKASILPYKIARAQYAVVPYYIWQHANPVPNYRHAEMRRFYTESEAESFSELSTIRGALHRNAAKVVTTILFFSGCALLPGIFLFRHVALDRRMRFFVWSVPFWTLGMAIGVFLVPHYLAPFTAVAYVLGLQALRHLRQFRFGGSKCGPAFVRGIVCVCLTMAAVRVVAEPLRIAPAQWPLGPWLCTWIGPTHFGMDRANVQQQLERAPGRHLVLVRYSPRHEPGDEWVYNAADPDNSKVVWARQMNPAQDAELLHYYADRDVWLVQPDVNHGRPIPYPHSEALRAQLSARP